MIALFGTESLSVLSRTLGTWPNGTVCPETVAEFVARASQHAIDFQITAVRGGANPLSYVFDPEIHLRNVQDSEPDDLQSAALPDYAISEALSIRCETCCLSRDRSQLAS
jgi:hypothetical protein